MNTDLKRRRDFGDTLDVQQMDTQRLLVLLKAEAGRRGLATGNPIELTFVSEEIVDGVRITRGTLPSGTPFVLRKQAGP